MPCGKKFLLILFFRACLTSPRARLGGIFSALTALKILAIRQDFCGFLPCRAKNLSRQSAHAEILNRLLELKENGEAELLRLVQELGQARRQRRKAKDTMGETLPVLEWMDENRAVVKRLERLLGDVRKAERYAENRIYTPRRPGT